MIAIFQEYQASKFFEEHPNVEKKETIGNYSLYALNKDVLKQVNQPLHQNQTTSKTNLEDNLPPSVCPQELKNFKYGALRQTENPFNPFDFESHKSDYDSLG